MEQTLTNGARWQDGIERRLEQNTDAINILALKVQQLIDRQDSTVTECGKCPKRFSDIEGKLLTIERYNDRLKWGLGLVTTALVAAWGIGSKWLAKQMGW